MTTQNNFHKKDFKGNQQKQFKKEKNYSRFDLFTGGKTPAFALFYNLAQARIAGIVYQLLGNTYTHDEGKIQTFYENWLKNPEDTSGKIFPKLRDYLWKGYSQNKNSDGYLIEEKDKRLIIKMLKTLENVRNFHSHIWHDNVAITIDSDLKEMIENLHRNAYISFAKENIKDVENYEIEMKDRPFFSIHDHKNYFKKDGRIFFLSFFLTSSEMSRFLQQCKDYKRQDTAKDKFLHKVFRFYTHRDGATRQHYGHSENMMQQMGEDEKKQTLNGKQAYKLISYLNDIPTYCRDTNLQKLYLNGKMLESAQDYIDFCKKYDLFQTVFTISPLMRTRKDEEENEIENESNQLIINVLDKKYSDKEEKEKERLQEEKQKMTQSQRDEQVSVVPNILPLKMAEDKLKYYESSLNDPTKMLIHFSKNTLHRLILDAFRRNDKGENCRAVLSNFIDERKEFYRFCYDKDFKDSILELYKFEKDDEYYDVYYRFKMRNEDLIFDMGKWREGKEWKDGFEAKVLQEPIEVDYYDFYYEQEQKIRKQDSFLYFSIRYLIDFQITNWYWLVEKFEIEEEKRTIEEYGKKVEKTFMVNKRRVKFARQIPEDWRLAIDDENHAMIGFFADETGENERSSNQATHKFSIGHKVLKALMMTHFDRQRDETMPLNNFFNPIIADIETIRSKNNAAVLQILDKNELPKSFKILRNLQAKDNLESMKNEAIQHLDKKIKNLRNIISGEGDSKYWRRADKNRFIMDCYTYFEWNYPNNNKFKFLRKNEYQNMSVYHYCLDKKKQGTWKAKNFEFLMKDVRDHIPDEILVMLSDAKSFDDLFTIVAEKTCELLNVWKRQIPNLPNKQAKQLLTTIGINYDENKPKVNATIPFAIHPMLVIRYFYKEDYEKGKGKIKLENNENYSQFGLGFKFKNAHKPLQKKLIANHYNFEKYIQHLDKEGVKSNAICRKIKGEANNSELQDLILAKMADRYLIESNDTYRAFLKELSTSAEWKAQSMRKTIVKQTIKHDQYGKIDFSIRFHQLDDYLLVESKEIIKKAIGQVLKRHSEKPNSKIRNVFKTDDGYEVPYEEVFKEIQRVYNDALEWVDYLLFWEQSVISRKQDWSESFINFLQICREAGLNEEHTNKLNKLRKNVFHAKIPSEYAYWELRSSKAYDWLRQLVQYGKKREEKKGNVKTKKL
jgi:hypothetical protein